MDKKDEWNPLAKGQEISSEDYQIGYFRGFENGYIKAIEVAITNFSEEGKIKLAVESIDYMPFPKIIKHFRISYHQAMDVAEQVKFREYVKDEFDLYVENDGFFDQESMDRIYQLRLRYAKSLIEDIPASEIISTTKILSKDLKTMLIGYVKEIKEKKRKSKRSE